MGIGSIKFSTWFFLALTLPVLPVAAKAQSVRHETNSFSALLRAADHAADDQKNIEWPRILNGESGTQVHVTFDLGNADVSIFTQYDFGVDRSVTEARRIAAAIGYPEADYITSHGIYTLDTDVELNKYMVRSALICPLILGKSQRRREVEADRFAVEQTGDPELVIRALRKLHTLSATPHMLKPSDENLMMHPSLAHRIEAIRETAPEA